MLDKIKDKIKKKTDPLESDNELMLKPDDTEHIPNPHSIPNVSAREEARAISKGIEEPRHIGNYTPLMISQEIISLANVKPAFRDAKWHKRAGEITQLCNTIKDPRTKKRITDQCRSYLQRGSV